MRDGGQQGCYLQVQSGNLHSEVALRAVPAHRKHLLLGDQHPDDGGLVYDAVRLALGTFLHADPAYHGARRHDGQGRSGRPKTASFRQTGVCISVHILILPWINRYTILFCYDWRHAVRV